MSDKKAPSTAALPGEGGVELRYLGFDQQDKLRAYRFERVAHGVPAAHFVVTADIALFVKHHVALQEGPAIGALKLTADFNESAGGTYAVTESDIRAHLAAKNLADNGRPLGRKSSSSRTRVSASAETASLEHEGLDPK